MEKKSYLNKILLGIVIGLSIVAVGIGSILYGFNRGTNKNRLNNEAKNKYVTNNNSVQKNDKEDTSKLDENSNIENDYNIENNNENLDNDTDNNNENENNSQEIETEDNKEDEPEDFFDLKKDNDEDDSLIVKLGDAEITDKSNIISKSDLIDKFFDGDSEYKEIDEVDDYEELEEEPTEKPFPDLDNLINNEENNNEQNNNEENNNEENNDNNDNNDNEENNNENNNETDKPVLAGVPEKFDLRDKVQIVVEDQGSYDLSWDFAGLKSLETNVALRLGTSYNFSEIHADYMMTNLLSTYNRKVHTKGTFEDFVKYNVIFKGVVLQDKLEYKDYSEEDALLFYGTEKYNIFVTDYKKFQEYNPTMKEQWGEEKLKEYTDSIKEHIMKNGSIAINTYSPINESVVNYYYNNKNELSNEVPHYMSIIGWDDTYSKENFVSPNGVVPENDGAYIVLNSWGESAGDNGYIYISYEDCFVHNEMYGIISTNQDIDSLIDLDSIDNIKLINGIKQRYSDSIINIDGKDYINKIEFNYINGDRILDLSNMKLTSLKGIEIFNEMVEIDLSNNELTTAAELNSIPNLQKVNLANNNLVDVSVLQNNKMLTYIDLSNNTDVKGYDMLAGLKSLILDNCNLTDISFIINLPNELNILDLSNNAEITDYSALQSIKKINTLVLKNNGITDVTKICNNEIVTLDLSENKEITNISELTNVTNLIMRNCNITDVSIFSELQLQELDLSENTGLTGVLTNVKSLILENCNLEDEFDFFGNDSFDKLSIYGNNISLEYVLNTVSCNKVKCNDIKYTELDKIPENVKLFDTVIIIDCKFSNENVKFRLIPEIRKYSSNSEIVDSYENVKINKTLLRGRITSEYGVVKIKNINSNKYENCYLKFNMDVLLSDMMDKD